MLKERSDEAARDVIDLLGVDVDATQLNATAKIIEAAMIDAYRDSAKRCAHVARGVCEEDEDMAHKLAREIKRANTALIANLESLR